MSDPGSRVSAAADRSGRRPLSRTLDARARPCQQRRQDARRMAHEGVAGAARCVELLDDIRGDEHSPVTE
jgi:hypothetical protein